MRIANSHTLGQSLTDMVEFGVNGVPFLSLPCSIGFMLNIDWFCPFKHSEYSVGAIYLSIMNLPRKERFKRENILLLGLIPGPSEASLTINSFLEPIVTELLQLWNGVNMDVITDGGTTSSLVRAALLAVACDLPAARKVCGFLSYSATLGCSHCLKRFEGSIGNKDYSGFDRSTWLQ